MSKPDKYTPFRWYFRFVIQRSDRRHRKPKKYNIDLKYLYDLWNEQLGICPITGWKLTLRTGSDKRLMKIDDASLDRIDCQKGYVKGNVRFVAYIANISQNIFTDQELKKFCKAVIRHDRLQISQHEIAKRRRSSIRPIRMGRSIRRT